MPGTTPPTSQLDWLSSTTAMIVLFWSRATRDLLKSFGWGIAALHSVRLQRRSCHVLAARPIGSSSSAPGRHGFEASSKWGRSTVSATVSSEQLPASRQLATHYTPWASLEDADLARASRNSRFEFIS